MNAGGVLLNAVRRAGRGNFTSPKSGQNGPGSLSDWSTMIGRSLGDCSLSAEGLHRALGWALAREESRDRKNTVLLLQDHDLSGRFLLSERNEDHEQQMEEAPWNGRPNS